MMQRKRTYLSAVFAVSIAMSACGNTAAQTTVSQNETRYNVEESAEKTTTVVSIEAPIVIDENEKEETELIESEKKDNIVKIDAGYEKCVYLTDENNLKFLYQGAVSEDIKFKDVCCYGYNFYIAVTENGDLMGWQGDAESYMSAELILSDVKQAYTNNKNGVYVKSNGDLYVWGNNNYREEGNYDVWFIGDEIHDAEKKLENIVMSEVGGGLIAALTDSGELYMWGWNDKDPVKVMDNVIDISVSERNVAAISNNNELFIWNYDEFGSVENGKFDYSGNYDAPKKIMENVIDFDWGGEFAAAVTDSGELYVWGGDERCELNHGQDLRVYEPVKVGDNFKLTALGYDMGYAVTRDNDIYTWQLTDFGYLEKIEE